MCKLLIVSIYLNEPYYWCSQFLFSICRVWLNSMDGLTNSSSGKLQENTKASSNVSCYKKVNLRSVYIIFLTNFTITTRTKTAVFIKQASSQ